MGNEDVVWFDAAGGMLEGKSKQTDWDCFIHRIRGSGGSMKLSNVHEFFNAMCCGCNAAVKQEDVDPDSLYKTWLCGRCCAELEQLPPRHKIVFDKLKREMDSVVGKVRFLEGKIAILEGVIIANGLNPQAANDSYAMQK